MTFLCWKKAQKHFVHPTFKNHIIVLYLQLVIQFQMQTLFVLCTIGKIPYSFFVIVKFWTIRILSISTIFLDRILWKSLMKRKLINTSNRFDTRCVFWKYFKIFLEGKQYSNNFREHDCLRYLKVPHFSSLLRSTRKRSGKFKSRKKSCSWKFF